MKSLFYTLLLITSLLGALRADTCTELCNLEGLVSSTTEICATDHNTYKAPLSAIVGLPPPFTCYHDCGLAVLYPGSCGCPNNCGSAGSRGACVNNTCVCAKGWGGEDCHTVVCPNSCSGHGKCDSAKKHLDICKCDEGFTGVDCSTPTLDIPVLPYGEVSPGSVPYFKKDKYGDSHPIFNLSVIGNWYVEMDPETFEALLNPANTYNQSREDAEVYFSNGNVRQKVHKASMKLKGHFARLAVKKSFSLRIKDDFFNIENIVLKAASLDPTYLKNQVTVEYLRSMMVPSARASYATLTINGVFWGLFWMKEEIDEDFIHERYGNDKGNFYGMSKYINYIGDDQELYQNCSGNQLGDIKCYNEEFGNGNWSDLIQLVKFLNESSTDEFTNQIEQIFNVDNFLRAMVVLSAIDDPDSFTRNGNNWALYSDPDAKLWQFVAKDFEDTMFNPLNRAYASVADNKQAVLAYRIMAVEAYQEKFKKYYVEFLKSCFSPKIENATVQRVKALEAFLLPVVATDEFLHITYGLNLTDGLWQAAVKELQVFLQARYLSLEVQFAL